MDCDSEKLRPVLRRCINPKRILILEEISKSNGETATALLIRLSKESPLPLSTLKLNFRKLKDLGLVPQENFKPVKLTHTGLLVLKILNSQSSLNGKAVACKTANPGSKTECERSSPADLPGSEIRKRNNPGDEA